MLDAFKKRGAGDEEKSAKDQAAELQELISTAREERAALSTMLTQIELQGGKLPALGRSMQSVTEHASGAAGKVDALTKRLSTLEARASGLGSIDTKIESLRSEVGAATGDGGAAPVSDGRAPQASSGGAATLVAGDAERGDARRHEEGTEHPG